MVLDIHNYGAYWLSNGTQGVRRAIGSAEVTVAHFASLWANLSTAFKANAGVAGYGLMNEPPPRRRRSPSPARRGTPTAARALQGRRARSFRRIPPGTAPCAYAVCFRNLTGPLTATGGLTFTVT